MGASKKANGLTPLQERFAQQYSRHGNAARAYAEVFGSGEFRGKREAFPSWIRVSASKILALPQVQRKIRELHNESRAATLVDHFRLVRMYLEAFDCAKELGNAQGMVKATTDLAKLGGFIKDPERGDNKRPMSPEEVRAELRRIDDELARVSGVGAKARALPAPAD